MFSRYFARIPNYKYPTERCFHRHSLSFCLHNGSVVKVSDEEFARICILRAAHDGKSVQLPFGETHARNKSGLVFELYYDDDRTLIGADLM